MLDLFDDFLTLSKVIKSYTPKVFIDHCATNPPRAKLRQLVEALQTELTHLEKVVARFHPELKPQYTPLVTQAEKILAKLSEH